MKLTFIGADHEVTGSCHYLECGRTRLLVDCGMEQGTNVYENVDLPVGYGQIDYVLLTHAHIDHAGHLPLIYARGFRGKLVTTTATGDLCGIMLRDSAHIQEMEAEWKNRKARRAGKAEVEPLYTVADAEGVLEHLEVYDYDQMVELNDDITIRFTDAGHLLGSASIEIWCHEDGAEKKIVFSGDIGNRNKPLIRDPQYISEADYVVMECTYGDREHMPEGGSRAAEGHIAEPYARAAEEYASRVGSRAAEEYASRVGGRAAEGHIAEPCSRETEEHIARLAKIVQETLDKGGNVVIPAFAVGRTQELLYFFRHIKSEHMIHGHDGFPVYVDSPLAIEATHVFKENLLRCYDDETRRLVENGINPIEFPGLKLSVTSEESKAINFDTEPKVIISAAGMCDAGRIRHHLKHNLWRPECCVVFAGYQAAATLGRSLIDGALSVKLFGETIDVEARIEQLPGLSSHADRNGLLAWIRAFEKKPRQVFLVHGDDKVCDMFAYKLNHEEGLNAAAPFSGSVYDLAEGRWIIQTTGVPVEKKKAAQRRADSIFARLVAAGQRLIKVIERNEGGANKDLARFADQIQSLCDKWDR